MTNEVKLDVFASTVLNQATERREQLENELNEKLKHELQKIKAGLEIQGAKRLKREEVKIENSIRNIGQVVAYEKKTALIKHREELIEEMFVEITKKAVDFVNSDQYQDFLTKKINEGLAELGDGAEVILCKNDEKYKEMFNAKIINEDFIGGAIISNPAKGIMVNLTIKNSINNEREVFLEQYKLELGSVV